MIYSKELSAYIQECPTESIRRNVNKAIDDQWEELGKRALKPHDFSCIDPSFCNKSNCFEWEPDTIVSDVYEVEYIKRMK